MSSSVRPKDLIEKVRKKQIYANSDKKSELSESKNNNKDIDYFFENDEVLSKAEASKQEKDLEDQK